MNWLKRRWCDWFGHDLYFSYAELNKEQLTMRCSRCDYTVVAPNEIYNTRKEDNDKSN